jgi:hypothetical protein
MVCQDRLGTDVKKLEAAHLAKVLLDFVTEMANLVAAFLRKKQPSLFKSPRVTCCPEPVLANRSRKRWRRFMLLRK